MKNLFYILVLVFLFSCNNSSTTTNSSDSSIALSADEYDFESIKGSNYEKAIRFNKDGKTTEEGFVKNGKKEGEWVAYDPKTGKLKSITSYLDGKLNGYYIEFDNRGYLVLMVSFINDELDGKFTKYKYNKIIEESNYKNGKLHGIKIKNYDSGRKQEEVEYKDGIIDGVVRYFNDKEELIMEYTYKNGKKVSGGMVNKKEGDNKPR